LSRVKRVLRIQTLHLVTPRQSTITTMALGSNLRKFLPQPIERSVAEAYRSAFVDLDELARTINSLGKFESTVEVGCGEGALTTRLTKVCESTVLGIDIAAGPGRNYVGDPARASFRQMRVESLVEEGFRADLVVVSDVVHHIPSQERLAFLGCCAALLAPFGVLVVKDWERRANPFHLLGYVSDRYLSGDRTVSFASRDELVALLKDAAPQLTLVCETRVPPRRNNLLLGMQLIA